MDTEQTASPGLPDDIEALRAMVMALMTERDSVTRQLDAVTTERDTLLARNERLHHLLLKLKRMQFGTKSERLPDEQLQLGLEAIEQAIAQGEAEVEKRDPEVRKDRVASRRGRDAAWPRDLPRIEVTLEPDDKACPCCRATMVVIGEDSSERLDKIPAQYRVIVTKRPKLACRACPGTVVQKPAPPRLIEGGIPTEALVAQVVVSRFADHQPLYRQAQMMAREGVILERSTLSFWIGYAAAEVAPVVERLREMLRIHPASAAADLGFDERHERMGFPRNPRFGGVTAVGDPAEGDLERELIDLLGIPVLQVFGHLGVVWMIGVGESFEHVVVAGNAAAVFGRTVQFAANIMGVRHVWLAGSDVGDGDPMLPAVAEVVEVFDLRSAGLQHIAQADLDCLHAGGGTPVLIHRQPVGPALYPELPEVLVEPSHRDLDDVVQDLERERSRHLHLAPDQRVGVRQLDPDRADLVKAVSGPRLVRGVVRRGLARAHAANLTARFAKFQGSNSSSREAG